MDEKKKWIKKTTTNKEILLYFPFKPLKSCWLIQRKSWLIQTKLPPKINWHCPWNWNLTWWFKEAIYENERVILLRGKACFTIWSRCLRTSRGQCESDYTEVHFPSLRVICIATANFSEWKQSKDKDPRTG